MRNRNAWSDTFVDALCEPPEAFSFGVMFAHVITMNTHQRLLGRCYPARGVRRVRLQSRAGTA